MLFVHCFALYFPLQEFKFHYVHSIHTYKQNYVKYILKGGEIKHWSQDQVLNIDVLLILRSGLASHCYYYTFTTGTKSPLILSGLLLHQTKIVPIQENSLRYGKVYYL